jgi:MYXO-CTERM domain-containing protein
MAETDDLEEPGRAAPGRQPGADFLQYRDVRDDRPQRRRFMLDVAAGLFVSFFLAVVCGFFWMATNLHFGPVGGQPPPIEWHFPLGVTFVLFALLGAGTLWARRRGWHGFVMGALIGTATSGLLAGVCFLRI